MSPPRIPSFTSRTTRGNTTSTLTRSLSFKIVILHITFSDKRHFSLFTPMSFHRDVWFTHALAKTPQFPSPGVYLFSQVARSMPYLKKSTSIFASFWTSREEQWNILSRAVEVYPLQSSPTSLYIHQYQGGFAHCNWIIRYSPRSNDNIGVSNTVSTPLIIRLSHLLPSHRVSAYVLWFLHRIYVWHQSTGTKDL